MIDIIQSMWCELALLATWIIVIPYLIIFPPQRFYWMRRKMQDRADVKAVAKINLKPKWIAKVNNIVTIPAKQSPVLVLVNPKSGGQLGATLLANLRAILHPAQVVNLVEETPLAAMQRFKGAGLGGLKVVVCGGDGTVGWAMNSADQECTSLGKKSPWPIAILPLGTGNDLARSIGWGAGATQATVTKDALKSFLGKVANSKLSLLDRWTVTVTELENPAKKKILTMNNYVSIGIDAEIGMKFHTERQRHPERFSSQSKNVVKYAMMGFEQSFEGVPLGEHVSCSTAEGALEVNPHWKGLVVNNLPCYQGGKDFWGTQDGSKDNFTAVDVADGKLEVMGLSGCFHIGLVHLMIDQALRLSQTGAVTLKCEDSICIQVDGEPFDSPPCTIEVKHAGKYPILIPKDQQ